MDETIQKLCELADYVVTNGGEADYIFSAIDSIRELGVTQKALILACYEVWMLNAGRKLPVSYIESFMKEAREQ